MFSKKIKMNFSYLIVTFFGLGKFPYAPGTFGSLIAFPLYFILLVGISIAKGGIRTPYSFDILNYMICITTTLFLLGVWACFNYIEKKSDKDPKEVIIDEVVGQLLTVTLILAALPNIGTPAILSLSKLSLPGSVLINIVLLLSFILFRIFDIFKPWPICYIDKNIKGAFGIMLDDIIAAIMAFFTFLVLTYLVTDILTQFYSI